MTASAAPERLPLLRPEQGRVLAGVARGLSIHFRQPVRRVRLVLLVSSLAAGAGAALYLWLWLFLPSGDPASAAATGRPVERSRLAPKLQTTIRSVPMTDLVLGGVLLGVSLVLTLSMLGIDLPNPWVVPVLVVIAGATLVWSQLDASLSASRGPRAGAMARVLGGLGLAIVGIVVLLSGGRTLDELATVVIAVIAVVAGIAVILAPMWVRLMRDLGAERTARAREAERADIAAHLHDSVLQTLSLIRARASDAEQVARLARAQERQLRDWLYTDRPEVGTSVADAVRQVAGEVEDLHAVTIDVVTAGDRRPDGGTSALLAATREALVNAAVHGAEPISLYVETTDEATEVFVRDRGPGFDLSGVGQDRHGVRESIIGRIERHGGTARILSRVAAGSGGPPSGTEVIIRLPAKEES